MAAQEVRKRLIDSVVVAIGTNVNDEEIETIATDSDSIYRYDSTAEIGHLEISDRVCPGSKQLILTLNVPIKTKVVCFSRLLKCLRSLYGKQCGPRSDCFYRSSLLWVHAVCFYT